MLLVNIPIIAYSPVGRGFLSGKIHSLDDMAPNDMRRHFPRFQPAVFDQNLRLVEAVETIAHRKGVSLAAVAIAWVAAQGALVLPGASTAEQVVENCGATEVRLSEKELTEIRGLLDTLPVAGPRYGGHFEALLNG